MHLEVDIPTIAGGTFSYLWVQGKDYYGCNKLEFDYQRVAYAIRTGIDCGRIEDEPANSNRHNLSLYDL